MFTIYFKLKVVFLLFGFNYSYLFFFICSYLRLFAILSFERTPVKIVNHREITFCDLFAYSHFSNRFFKKIFYLFF